MAKIFVFPDPDDRYLLKLEAILDKSLFEDNTEIRECIKNMIVQTLIKYKRLPAIDIDVPIQISKVEEKLLVDALSKEYNSKVLKFARSLITDLCLLHAELCKLKHGQV